MQWEYDKLSGKSGRSRNELMCMALRYALENLEEELPPQDGCFPYFPNKHEIG